MNYTERLAFQLRASDIYTKAVDKLRGQDRLTAAAFFEMYIPRAMHEFADHLSGVVPQRKVKQIFLATTLQFYPWLLLAHDSKDEERMKAWDALYCVLQIHICMADDDRIKVLCHFQDAECLLSPPNRRMS
jgi:hypothetical protein